MTPRLQAIADEVPLHVRFADIGTDHAYLPTWLLLNGRIEAAIAADLRAGPLKRAEETAQRYGVAERISLRLGSGLEVLSPEETDVIAIAGMGGELIAHLLEQTPWAADGAHRFLLQPMSAQDKLRQFLTEQGFCIEREILVREGSTLYVLFCVVAGQCAAYSPAELQVGRQTAEMQQPLRLDYLNAAIRRFERALAGLSQATLAEQLSRKEQYRQVLSGIIAMREEWISWQV